MSAPREFWICDGEYPGMAFDNSDNKPERIHVIEFSAYAAENTLNSQYMNQNKKLQAELGAANNNCVKLEDKFMRREEELLAQVTRLSTEVKQLKDIAAIIKQSGVEPSGAVFNRMSTELTALRAKLEASEVALKAKCFEVVGFHQIAEQLKAKLTAAENHITKLEVRFIDAGKVVEAARRAKPAMIQFKNLGENFLTYHKGPMTDLIAALAAYDGAEGKG